MLVQLECTYSNILKSRFHIQVMQLKVKLLQHVYATWTDLNNLRMISSPCGGLLTRTQTA